MNLKMFLKKVDNPYSRSKGGAFRKKCITLVGLSALMTVLLIYSRSSQKEIDEYYVIGVSSLNKVSDTLNSMVTELSSSAEPSTTTETTAAAYLSTSTTNILEYNEPDLHKTATVMAMATGYALIQYEFFVGSLRKTGFEGNIILIVNPDFDEAIGSYFQEKNVTIHKIQKVNCTHNIQLPLIQEKLKKGEQLNDNDKELTTCVHPYPKLKNRWARFPLLRDLLKDCGGLPNPEVQCGGPVLITDMRDTIFQRNPFGPEAPKVRGLQVFQEHFTIRTTNWLVDWPVGDCKGVHYDEPMLCSGTTIGTRQAMLDYLTIFEGEINVWMNDPKCNAFETNGDDQSIHNYIYYSGMLQNVTGGVQSVKNRNGLVHTVGAHASIISRTHINLNNGKIDLPYDMSADDKKNGNNWLGLQYGLTDQDGYFTDFDGSHSFVIHQIDRFGSAYSNWVFKQADRLWK